MKIAKILLVLAATTASLGLTPSAAWAIRAVGVVVTGPLTSAPTSTQIEIAHHVYRIKANSPAAAAARSFYYGQVVDATFDKPAVNAQPEIISIAAHKD